jgi:hypothetical protein
MRCLACDKRLTQFAATRKSAESLEFVDLCDRCFEHIRGTFEVIERDDLKCFEELDHQYLLTPEEGEEDEHTDLGHRDESSP